MAPRKQDGNGEISTALALAGGYGLTQAQLRRGVDLVVDAVNERLDASGDAHEDAAKLLYEASFGHDHAAALNLGSEPSPAYRLLRERAGASLTTTSDELSTHVRIGALNDAGHGDGWNRLRWSKKVALLPILGHEKAAELFPQGVAFANRPNVGVRHLRAWVKEQRAPALPGEAGAAVEPDVTLAVSRRAVATGVKLKSPKARKALARQLNKAPVAERKAFKRDLTAAAENMLKLAQEIDDRSEG